LVSSAFKTETFAVDAFRSEALVRSTFKILIFAAETFDRDMPIKFLPIKFEKLRLKLEAARKAGYDKAITFEFSHFMSPQSSYISAAHLYERYKEYVKMLPR